MPQASPAARRRPVLALLLASALLSACATGGGGDLAQPSALAPASSLASPVAVSPVAGTPSASTVTGPACPLDGTVAAASPLVPARGAWFGMSLDWGRDSVPAVRDRVGAGRTPAAWVQFAGFPIDAADESNLDGFIEQVRGVGGIGLITLEPNDGLAAVTPAAADAAAALLADYRACGVPLLVRFAHEMNGSWYRWGQDPERYVAAFRTVAASIHRLAPGVAVVWAPNSGAGYPFAGGAHAATPGSAAALALDTNDDGVLSAIDDPYAPYWPGNDAVDWVGMSAYHFGNTYPWGANVVPRNGAFAALVTGSRSDGASTTPDFHATWAVGHGKPMAVVETAALWRPAGGGASARAIKQAWWREVFSAATRERFPAIRLIGWFEWSKHEPEVDDVVDWRLTFDPALVERFAADLPPDWLRFAPAP